MAYKYLFPLVAAFIFLAGCKKHSDNPLTPIAQEKVVFTHSPMNFTEFVYATPLGNLNPPGHTFPTDHVYFYWINPDRRTPGDMDTLHNVYAPGNGTVQFIYQHTDYKIGIAMNDTFSYYLDHVMLNPEITTGTLVKAGQIIGTASKLSYAVDLGVINTKTTLTGFINPSRYPDQTIHTESPYKYFATSLRDSIYSKITRIGNDKDGKIDYDIKGKLSGGWFLNGLPMGDASSNYDSWPKHLAFVYDMNEPTSIRISIGGTLTMRGVYGVKTSATDPALVSVASGKIGYQLFSPYNSGTYPLGVMIVQMISDDTIKVETFQSVTDESVNFDAGVLIYTR